MTSLSSDQVASRFTRVITPHSSSKLGCSAKDFHNHRRYIEDIYNNVQRFVTSIVTYMEIGNPWELSQRHCRVPAQIPS